MPRFVSVLTKGPAGQVGISIDPQALSVLKFKEMPDGLDNPGETADPPIQVGDKIVGVDGAPVATAQELSMKLKKTGKRVKLTIERSGKPASSGKSMEPDFVSVLTKGPKGIGVTIEPKNLTISGFKPIEPNPGREAKPPLQIGDKIVAVDLVPVKNTAELAARVKGSGQRLRLGIKRGGESGSSTQRSDRSMGLTDTSL